VRASEHALAHITGGGIPGNLERVLPPNVDAVVREGSWPVPVWCEVVQRGGRVDAGEMRRVFNLGIGLIAVCAAGAVDEVRSAARRAGVETWVIGEAVLGEGRVRFEA
jgi:phosphoribosylformylglycinamidine cyclo-ligase